MLPRFIVILITLLLFTTNLYAFSFSEEEAMSASKEFARRDHVADLLDVPCKSSLKGKKIGVVVGEMHNGRVVTKNIEYSALFDLINQRLKAIGLKTYTHDEIKKQVAQAEIEAYMNNDPDAAIAASRKLGASFMLKGVISSTSAFNPVVGIKEVSVMMTFTLTSSSGKTISIVDVSMQSWSGADVFATAHRLVKEEADIVVAKLYNDFCRNAQSK